MTQEEQGNKIGQLIAKCWADEGFKQKLLSDTMATLKEEGAELPAGLTVKALENTDSVFHLVIPAKPTDLSDDDLDKVAGGWAGPRMDNHLNYLDFLGKVFDDYNHYYDIYK